jgi:hypothetical protein
VWSHSEQVRRWAGIGAHYLYPDVQTVLYIGGQDKVILVKPKGGAARLWFIQIATMA